MKARNLFILVVITAVVVAAAAYSLKPRDPLPEAGALVFPGLLERVNDIDTIEVTAGGKSYSLTRAEAGWVAPDRGNHPLDADRVHTTLVGTAGLAFVEPQTSNPELYARLGVEEPDSEDTTSVRLTLRAGADELASYIVGQSRPAKGSLGASEYSLRRTGEAQTWLTRGRLPDDVDTVVTWLDERIATVATERLMRGRVMHPDGGEVTVYKEAPGPGNFALEGAGKEGDSKEVWRLNDIGRLLSDLTLEDVRPAKEVADAFEGEVRRFESRTFDGLVVLSEVVESAAEEHLMRLSASFDASQAGRGASLDSTDLLDEAAVREEVETLNARWGPWVYVIPRFKASYLDKTMADLMPEPEPPTPAPAAGASTGG